MTSEHTYLALACENMAYKCDDHMEIVEESLACIYIWHIANVRLLPGQEGRTGKRYIWS